MENKKITMKKTYIEYCIFCDEETIQTDKCLVCHKTYKEQTEILKKLFKLY